MITYIIRRILVSIPILFLVVSLVFFAFQIIPGDPARMYAGEQASLEMVEQARKDLELDRPMWKQYASYLGRLSRGDLGKSYITRRPVALEVGNRFWNTVKLALAATLLSTLLGISMGTVSAARREGRWDYLLTVLTLMGISMPIFWLALLAMYFFSVQLKVLPTTGNDTWRHYIMPTATLSVYSTAFVTRMTRSTVLEAMSEDHVRTARAKGLREYMVMTRHVLRNALIPIVTVVGLQFGYMLGGAVVTETIFAWPGMGRLLIFGVSQRDIPLVQGTLVIFAAAFVFVNLAVDVIYAFIDPRIRYA